MAGPMYVVDKSGTEQQDHTPECGKGVRMLSHLSGRPQVMGIWWKGCCWCVTEKLEFGRAGGGLYNLRD